MDNAESHVDDDPTLWRMVLHRWFVQYNPLYLVSAALVLGGVITLSQGIAGAGVFAQLGVTAVAEAYAWALIGGAALLVRIGMRRPAVMLALLAALYQADPTLHTATCAFLGPAGVIGSALWFASFVGKLRALAWAMKLKASRGSVALIVAGALGLTAMPWLLRTFEAATASVVLVLWIFGLLAAGLWSHRRIDSLTPLGPWPATVARRSLGAIWIGWGGASVLHMLFWAEHVSGTSHLDALLPAALLLVTRAIAAERSAWAVVGVALGLVAVAAPALLPVTLVMAAVVLALRACRCPAERVPGSGQRRLDDPYRVPDAGPSVEPSPSVDWVLHPAPRDQAQRLWVGAATCLYLAAWWNGWQGGALPSLTLMLDLAFATGALLAARILRRGLPLVPATLTWTHCVIVRQWVPLPTSSAQVGVLSVILGFALLMVALAMSVRWSRTVPHERRGES